MGRIKSAMIKRAAQEAYSGVEGFTEDFEHNKKLLVGTMPYKSMRNRVAGAIVRLSQKARQKKEKEKMQHHVSAEQPVVVDEQPMDSDE